MAPERYTSATRAVQGMNHSMMRTQSLSDALAYFPAGLEQQVRHVNLMFSRLTESSWTTCNRDGSSGGQVLCVVPHGMINNFVHDVSPLKADGKTT